MKLTSLIFFIGLFIFTGCAGKTPEVATPTSTTEISPSSTQTLKPSETPTPTKPEQPTITPTATPTAINTNAAIFSQIKDFPYNFSWVQDGSLIYWDIQNQDISYLAGIHPESVVKLDHPVAYAELLDENRYLIAQDMQNGDSRVEEYDVGIVDLSTETYRSLFEIRTEEKYAPLFQVSPDKEWVAFYTIFSSAAYDTELGGHSRLYSIRVFNLGTNEIFEMGTCVDHFWNWSTWCEQPMVWNPATNWLAWHGDGGLWIGKPGERDPFELLPIDYKYLLLPDLLASNPYHALQVPLAWSPDGRFLLAEQHLWEAGTTIIIDSITGKYDEVPDGDETYGLSSGVYWLNDGTLAVFHSDFSKGSDPPEVALYHPQTHGDQLLIQEDRNQIPIGDIRIPFDPYETVQISNNDLLILTYLFSPDSEPSLLTLELNSLEIKNNYTLDTGSEMMWPSFISWSPTNQWILFNSFNKERTYLTPVDGSVVYEITDVISYESCCIHWIMP